MSSVLLARDSYILSLETQIELLKIELKSKNCKERETSCTQTFNENLFYETSTQSLSQALSIDKQTSSTIFPSIKNICKNEPLDAHGLIESLSKEDEENTKPQLRKPGTVKNVYLRKLSFISAMNFKSDLPVKDTCPLSIPILSTKSNQKKV